MKTVKAKMSGGFPDVDLVVHYKETPKQVLESVNKLLIQHEIDAEFVAHPGDSDTYLFSLVAKREEV
jgi:hypothetical protein